MRVRRGLLFMPGDDRRKIEKGAACGVDSVIMDLEDGVALNNKPAARVTIAAALREVDFGRTEKLVRTTAITPNGFYAEDIQATVAGHPDGYVLPKIETAAQIREVSSLLSAIERQNGWKEGGMSLLVLVETARGFVNLREIAESDPRLDTLILGSEDLVADLGGVRTPDGWEVFYARSALVMHAKAAGLQAVDMIHADFNDTEGLIAETQQALAMGYTGKTLIHPRQVEPVQAVFTPSTEEIARAKRLIDAHIAHQTAGTGAFALDGKMVDMPVVRAAEAVLARARAAGIEVD